MQEELRDMVRVVKSKYQENESGGKDMEQMLEKVKQRLEVKEACKYNPMTNVVSESELGKVLEEVSTEYDNGWIPVSSGNLPEEPTGDLDSIELIEKAIEKGKVLEYIVTTEGAKRATTLYYVGNDYWFDLLTEEFYCVAAWKPLPELYQKRG